MFKYVDELKKACLLQKKRIKKQNSLTLISTVGIGRGKQIIN